MSFTHVAGPSVNSNTIFTNQVDWVHEVWEHMLIWVGGTSVHFGGNVIGLTFLVWTGET